MHYRLALEKILALPQKGCLAAIGAYQRWISPLLGPRCKYYPSCSAYAARAIAVHGVGKGLLLGAWRILRCNPLSDGGVDHVPLPGRWDNPWTEPGSITAQSYEAAKTKEYN